VLTVQNNRMPGRLTLGFAMHLVVIIGMVYEIYLIKSALGGGVA